MADAGSLARSGRGRTTGSLRRRRNGQAVGPRLGRTLKFQHALRGTGLAVARLPRRHSFHNALAAPRWASWPVSISRRSRLRCANGWRCHPDDVDRRRRLRLLDRRYTAAPTHGAALGLLQPARPPRRGLASARACDANGEAHRRVGELAGGLGDGPPRRRPRADLLAGGSSPRSVGPRFGGYYARDRRRRSPLLGSSTGDVVRSGIAGARSSPVDEVRAHAADRRLLSMRTTPRAARPASCRVSLRRDPPAALIVLLRRIGLGTDHDSVPARIWSMKARHRWRVLMRRGPPFGGLLPFPVEAKFLGPQTIAPF